MCFVEETNMNANTAPRISFSQTPYYVGAHADYPTTMSVPRADRERLKTIFVKYASHEDSYGNKFMTRDDFVRKYT